MSDRKLHQPVFSEVPPIAKPNPRPPANLYKDLLDAVREHPGQQAMIAIFEVGGLKATLRRANTAKLSVSRFLAKHYSNEVWTAQLRRIPNTYSQRAMWVCFYGILTDEQMAELIIVRRELGSYFPQKVSPRRDSVMKKRDMLFDLARENLRTAQGLR